MGASRDDLIFKMDKVMEDSENVDQIARLANEDWLKRVPARQPTPIPKNFSSPTPNLFKTDTTITFIQRDSIDILATQLQATKLTDQRLTMDHCMSKSVGSISVADPSMNIIEEERDLIKTLF